jgi:hypothetical protein
MPSRLLPFFDGGRKTRGFPADNPTPHQLRLFIPIEENSEQHIYIIDKDENGNVTTKKEYGVRYVPLTDAPKV